MKWRMPQGHGIAHGHDTDNGRAGFVTFRAEFRLVQRRQGVIGQHSLLINGWSCWSSSR